MVMRVDFIFSRGGLLYEHANLLERPMCLHLLLLFFITPVLNSQGIKKLRYAVQKSTKIKLA